MTKESPLIHEIKHIIRGFLPLKIGVLFLAIITILLNLAIPIFIGFLIDNLAKPFSTILNLGLILMGIVLGSFLVNWLKNYLWWKLVYESVGEVRSKLFATTLENSFSFFKEKTNGDLTNIILNDANNYTQYLVILDLVFILNILQIVLIISFLCVKNFVLGVFTVVMLGLYFLVYRNLNEKLRKNAVAERKSFSKVLDSTSDFLKGNETIQLFSGQPFFTKLLRQKIMEHIRIFVKQQKYTTFSSAFVSSLFEFIPIMAVLIGAYFYHTGDMTMGAIIGVYGVLPYLAEPVRNLTDFNITLQNGKAVQGRIAELEPSLQSVGKTSSLPAINQICLEQVEMKFSDRRIFKNLSFTLKKGDVLAVQGPSGIGKTTLLNLILGNIEPTAGTIRVNQLDLRVIDRNAYRSKISAAFQTNYLYSGDLLHNITFSDNLDLLNLHEAKKMAVLEHFTDSQDITDVSGGERQRIGLARAFYKKCDVLILDEPTSALDLVAERKIMENLMQHEFLRDKITILITHHDALLSLATKVLTLDSNTSWKIETIREVSE